MAKRSSESLPWAFFGAGGFIAAFLIPVHIFLFGVAIPLGWIAAPTQASLLALIQHPLAKLYLLAFCVLGFLHAAHRLRSTLIDTLRIKHLDTAVGVLFYGAAIAGSVLTLLILVRIP
jgi:fumarate reductase subunit D